MFNSLFSHLKSNKTKYAIIAILILFVASVFVYNRVPNFNDLTSQITGDITRTRLAAPTKSSLQLLKPNGAESFQQPQLEPVLLEEIVNDNQDTCLGSDSNGGDGSYSACVGNTINHQPSGVLVTPLSFDDSKVELSFSGLPGNNVAVHTVYKDSTVQIGGNGYSLTYEYGGNYPSTGAYITISTTCISSNSAGEDGSYSGCIGNTITHHPSGLIATVLSYDDTKVDLLISELPGDNQPTITIYKGSRTYIGGNNGYEVIYQYDEHYPETGAYITISSNPPKKYLTIINVGDDIEYEQNPYYFSNKDFSQRDGINTLYLRIYNNDNPQKLGLYRFDENFDPTNSLYFTNLFEEYGGDVTRQAWIEHRENFKIFEMDIAEASREIWLAGLKIAFQKIVEDYPADHYGIAFRGHGSRGGTLFHGTLHISHSKELLQYINSIIGKRIDFGDK